MPDPALPVPRVEQDVPAARPRYRHRFEDAAGRPMSGTVTLTPQPAGAPVTRELRDGVLDLELAPGVYTLVALLRTADLTRQLTTDTITVTS